LRPGAKNIFAPPPTKTAEFEMKNWCESTKEAKAEHLLFVLLFFQHQKCHDKAISVSRSNKTGV